MVSVLQRWRLLGVTADGKIRNHVPFIFLVLVLSLFSKKKTSKHVSRHVASSIIGATKMTQLKENLDAFDVELSPSVLQQCEEVHLKYREPHLAD